MTAVVTPFLLAFGVLSVACCASLCMLLRKLYTRATYRGLISRERLMSAKAPRSDDDAPPPTLLATTRYWVELLSGIDEMRYWYRLWRVEQAHGEPDAGREWWLDLARAQATPTCCGAPSGKAAADAATGHAERGAPPDRQPTIVTDYPRLCMASYLSHADVSRLLAGYCELAGGPPPLPAMPLSPASLDMPIPSRPPPAVSTPSMRYARWFAGEDSAGADAVREEAVGMRTLNVSAFAGAPGGICLGASIEEHATFRNLAMAMFGAEGGAQVAWTGAAIRRAADAFFDERYSIRVPEDIDVWACQTVWQAAFGDCAPPLSADEAADLVAFHVAFRAAASYPESAFTVLGSCANACLGVRAVLAQRERWMGKIKLVLRGRFPAMLEHVTSTTLNMLASHVLDALSFGQTASHLLKTLLWMIVATDGIEARDGAELSLGNASEFVLETLRLYPPADFACFTYLEPFRGRGERTNLCLAAAARDPAAWGGDAGSFRLRGASEYESKSVAFAEPCTADHKNSPFSRSCPAKDLTVTMGVEFLHAFIHATRETVGADALSTDIDAAIEASPDVAKAAKRAAAAQQELQRTTQAQTAAQAAAEELLAPRKAAEQTVKRAELNMDKVEAKQATAVNEAAEVHRVALQTFKSVPKKRLKAAEEALQVAQDALGAAKAMSASEEGDARAATERARGDLAELQRAEVEAAEQLSRTAVEQAKARTALKSADKAVERARTEERQRRQKAKADMLAEPFDPIAWHPSVPAYEIKHAGSHGLQTPFQLDWHGDAL